MATVEINSFVSKFVNLWKSGLDASLKLESHAGQASLSISLGLGSFHETDEIEKKPYIAKKVSPSRARRRKRRAKARQDAVNFQSHAGVDQTSEEDVVLSQNSVEDTAVDEASEEDVSTQKVIRAADNAAEKVDIYEDDAGVTEFELRRFSSCDLEEKPPDLSTELGLMIKESQRKRNLWEKLNGLPS